MQLFLNLSPLKDRIPSQTYGLNCRTLQALAVFTDAYQLEQFRCHQLPESDRWH